VVVQGGSQVTQISEEVYMKAQYISIEIAGF